MTRREYLAQLEQIEPLVLEALREQSGPITLRSVRMRVYEKAKDMGVEANFVRSTIIRLWEAGKLRVTDDRQVVLA